MNPIPYKLKRSRRRRTIALQVDPGGTVTVLAPRYALSYFIERFVQKQADWIRDKLAYFEEFRKRHPTKEFVSGDSFPVWGQEVSLQVNRIDAREKPHCEWVQGMLQVFLREAENSQTKEEVKRLLREWYAQQTESQIQESLPKWAALMGVTPGTIKVANPQKRWGSCSRMGNLRFSLRLAMMPVSMLEYVIVHELAHIQAHDHSKRFWAIVNSVLPDYKTRRRWIREHGSHLNV